MFGSEQIGIGLAEQGSRIFEAGSIYHRATYRKKAALPVLEVDAIGQIIHQCLQEKAFSYESTLHFGALRHVP